MNPLWSCNQLTKALLMVLNLTSASVLFAKESEPKTKFFTFATVDGAFGNFINFQLPEGGLYIEIIRLAARDLGYEVTFDRWPVKRILATALRGKHLGVFPFMYDSARENDFYFSLPINRYKLMTFVANNSPRSSIDKKDVKTLKSCDNLGSVLAKTLAKKWSIEFEKVRSVIPQCLTLMEQNRIDFMFFPETLKYSLPEGYKFIPNDLEFFVDAHVLFPKNHPNAKQLTTDFNKALIRLESSGMMAKLKKKYEGLEVKVEMGK